MGDRALGIFLPTSLIRNQAKCYLVFLCIKSMELLSLNNLYPCMDATKIYILINIKIGWRCKVGREQFTPCQSEDPSCFQLFYLYQNAYNGEDRTLIRLIYIYVQTVPEEICRSNYSYNVEIFEYANIYIGNKSQGPVALV